jgi:hypothetical protein
MSRYDVAKIRNQVANRIKKGSDPSEFRPKKADEGETIKYRFYVLPPIFEGDQIVGGAAEHAMDLFFLENGAHFLENKRLGCPRIINEDECEICQFAFDCIQEIKDKGYAEKKQKEEITKVRRNLLPGTYRAVNIFFPGGAIGKCNPEELQGTVKWYNTPTTVFDIWMECLNRDDDGGDEFKPLPFGVFFDEDASYLFELTVTKKSGMQFNNYEKSSFLVSEKLGAHPIARLKGKGLEPDPEGIQAILAQRHNLFDKIPEVKVEEVKRIAANLAGRAEDDGGFDSDETRDEKETADKAESSEEQTAKTESKSKTEKTEKKGGIKPPVKSKEETPVEDDPLSALEDESGPDAGGDNVDTADELPVEDSSDAPAEEPAAESSDEDAEVDDLLAQLDED